MNGRTGKCTWLAHTQKNFDIGPLSDRKSAWCVAAYLRVGLCEEVMAAPPVEGSCGEGELC